MRLDVPKVLVLLTDGAQTVEDGAIAPSKAVEPFHEANIKVLGDWHRKRRKEGRAAKCRKI